MQLERKGVWLFSGRGLHGRIQVTSSWHRREALPCRAAVPSLATVADFKFGGLTGGAAECAGLRQNGRLSCFNLTQLAQLPLCVQWLAKPRAEWLSRFAKAARVGPRFSAGRVFP